MARTVFSEAAHRTSKSTWEKNQADMRSSSAAMEVVAKHDCS